MLAVVQVKCLKAAEEIKCKLLEDYQWVILHQIESTLQKMALWQRTLEGPLVVSAIFSIQEHYVNVIESLDIQAPLKSITTLHLKYFDKCYSPATNAEGKVSFV